MSSFFAATLALGLVPAAAFAAPESSDAAAAAASNEEQPTTNESSDVISTGEAEGLGVEKSALDPNGAEGAQSFSEGDESDVAADGSVIPAGDIINQEMPLEVVAQSESTRSFFLAQTLESTRTVPVVSAKLPIDTGSSKGDVAEGEPSDGADGDEGDASEEGGEDSDEADLADGLEGEEPAVPSINPDSVVIGSFEYQGIVYAFEPDGETVAAVAVDYDKLPEGYVQKQVLVVPEAVTPDGYEYYSVTRIAANAFSSLTKENANPDYTGAVALFSDEELLAEAGIDSADVAAFLPSAEDAAVAAKSDGSAGADLIDMPKTEALGYENPSTTDGFQEEESSNSVIPSAVEESALHSNSAEGAQTFPASDENDGEGGGSDDIRTIVSMDGDVATLDDGSTYEFTNPLAGCTGILALGVPASVSSIEDDAFLGFDTLQYLVVSEDNSSFASYDGALYSADLAQLRLIPEGRVGAVRVAPSATGVDSEVFSHCLSVDALVADAEGGIAEAARAGGKTILPDDPNQSSGTSLAVPINALLAQVQRGAPPVSLALSDIRQSMSASLVQIMNGSSTRTIYYGSRYNSNYTYEGAPSYPSISSFQCSSALAPRATMSTSGSGTSDYGHAWDYSAQYGIREGWSSSTNIYRAIFGFNLSSGGASQLPIGLIDANGNDVAYGSISAGLYRIKTINGVNILDHQVGWNTSGGGSLSPWYVPDTSRKLSGNTGKLGSLPVPVREGWALDGWYTDVDWKTKVTMETEVTKDTIFIARWKIAFNWYSYPGELSSTTGTAFSPGLYLPSLAYTEVKATPPSTSSKTPTGWSLYRWSRSATASSNDVTPGASSGATAYSTSGNNDYYARWQAPIKRNLNYTGQSDTAETTLYASGQNPTATYKPVSPTRTGYTFEDWTVDYVDGSLTDFTAAKDTTITFAGAATLRANWTPSPYKVSFSNAGSNKPEQLTKTYEGSVTLPSPGSYPGYTFGGWRASTDGKVYAEGSTYQMSTAASDVTFTAQWTKNGNHVITLRDAKLNKGDKLAYYWTGQGYVATDGATAVVSKGNKLVSSAPLAATGYEFLGYFDTSDNNDNADEKKMIAADGTLLTDKEITVATTWYAHWRPLVYTVNFASAGNHAQVSPASATFTIESPTIALPAVSDYEKGYEFANWSATSGITFTGAFPTGPSGSITVKDISASWQEGAANAVATISANYRLHTYSIGYDEKRYSAAYPNGRAIATAASGNPTAYQYDPSQANNAITVGNAPAITAPGYVFRGWYCPTLGETEADAAFPKTIIVGPDFDLKDLQFQAAYELIGHTITVHADGGQLEAKAGWSQKLGTSDYTYEYNAETVRDGHGLGAASIVLPAYGKTGWTPTGYTGDHLSGAAGSQSFALPFAAAQAGDPTKFDGATAFELTATYSVDANPLQVRVIFDDGADMDSAELETYTSGLNAADGYSLSYQVTGTALPDLTASTRHAYRFLGWTVDTDAMDDGNGNKLPNHEPHLNACIAPGFTPGAAGAPTTVYAHFAYQGFPFYVSAGEARAQVDDPDYAIVTDAAERASVGVIDPTVNLYKYSAEYTLGDEAAGIFVPQPTNQGRTFSGWADSAAGFEGELAAERDGFRFKPSESITAGEVAYRLFTAKWVDAPYTVKFTHLDHVASIAVETDSDAALAGGVLTLVNPQLDAGVTIGAVTMDDAYYEAGSGFARWVAEGVDLSGLEGWQRDGSDSWTSDPFTFTYGNIAKYFPNGATELTIRAEYSTAAAKEYQAHLLLEGGALSDADAAWWPDLAQSFTCETSGNVVLPKPSRTGYDFKGWTAYYDAGCTEAVPNHGQVTEGGVTRIPADSVRDRWYKASWAAKTTRVKFVYNAVAGEGDVTVPAHSDGSGFEVRFGSQMNALDPIDGGKFPVPTRAGYRFLGFFDTAASSGGKQYYTSTLGSARAWDKDEPGTSEYTLWARWTRVSDPDNIKVIPVEPADKARGLISAVPDSRAEGAGGTPVAVFNATYAGVYAWDTFEADPERPAATDDVTIDVSSYDFGSFDMAEVAGKFAYEANGERFELVGFYVGSGSAPSLVRLDDLLAGNAFQLKVKGRDLVFNGDRASTPPGFVIDPARVVPVYAKGGMVVTYFDANGGAFADGKSFTFTETSADKVGVEPPVAPAAPTRAGYDFKGWSLAEEHAGGDGCVADASKLAVLDSAVPRTYHAHWEAKSTRVTFVEAPDGSVRHTLGTVVYGSMLPDLGAEGGVPEPAEREGYVFKGYFDSRDAGAGTQYVNAAGQATRAWDKDVVAADLYALWVPADGQPVEKPSSDPKEDPNPDDPFPGEPGPYIWVPTDPDDDDASRILLGASTPDGSFSANVYDGIYDGDMRYTFSVSAERPQTASDSVKVSIYSYVPALVGGKQLSAHTAHERVKDAFEQHAPDGLPYLQGFTVLSTGYNIPITALHAGRSVEVECLGSDLVWTADGSSLKPASLAFAPGKMVAVYSATPVIDPGYDWPQAGTQVFNRFDAGVGSFPDAEAGEEGANVPTARKQVLVASAYGQAVTLPDAEPIYPFYGYEFDGWYAKVGDAYVPAGELTVDWTESRTFFAHYRKVEHALTLMTEDGELATITAWNGQPTSALETDFAAHVPQKAGYEFLGWYAYEGDDMANQATAAPYYMTSASSPNALRKVENVWGPATLYPYWGSRTYTVNWIYNHSGDYMADYAITWNGVEFGKPLPAAFPDPGVAKCEFYGWYPTQADALWAGGWNDNADIGCYFKQEGGAWVLRPDADRDASTINLYAGWGKAREYWVTLIAGERDGDGYVHGAYFDKNDGGDAGTWRVPATFNGDRPDETINLYDDDYLPATMAAGWQFAGWMEVFPGEEGKQPVAVPEGTKVKKGTGDHAYVAQWKVAQEGDHSIEFVLGDEVNTTDASGADYTVWKYEQHPENMMLTTRFDASTELVEVPRFRDESITGYDFAGWYRAQRADDGTLVPVEGAGFASIGSGVRGFTGQQLVQALADENRFAEGEANKSLLFVAKWEPKTFQVRYFAKKGTDAAPDYQQMSTAGLADEAWKDRGYHDRVVLPYPAFQDVGNIFDHWDGMGATNHNQLVAGASELDGEPLTVKSLIRLLGESNGNVTSEVVDGKTVHYLNLCAASVAKMTFTVPLQVNIAFDLARVEDSMETTASAALQVSTTSDAPARVESIAVQRLAAGDAFELEDPTAVEDPSALVDLMVKAYGGVAGSDAEDAAYLLLNLGQANDGAVYRDLSAAGFGSFTRTSPLQLDYRLRFASGWPKEGNAFKALQALCDARDAAGNLESIPVAKLFYTVGLVH